ncbi:MAG: PA14 domain-containing protein [Salibacteraceae bacterium]
MKKTLTLLLGIGISLAGLARTSELIGMPAANPAAQGDGLRAFYYPGDAFTRKPQSTIDPTIDFETNGEEGPIRGIKGTNFQARWYGYLLAPDNGTYSITFTADDGVRFWVNDQLLIDAWYEQPATDYTVQLNLKSGNFYEIKAEYFQGEWDGVARLSWKRPGAKRLEVIQQQFLFSTIEETGMDYLLDIENYGTYGTKEKVVKGLAYNEVEGEVEGGKGLYASYYKEQGFQSPVVRIVEPVVDHYWDYESPIAGVQSENFSVRWKGFLRAPESGKYRITFAADDGVRLQLGNKKLLNEWRGQLPNAFSSWVYLEKGKFYPISIDFYQQDFDATAKLKWSFEGSFETIIPQIYLYPEIPEVWIEKPLVAEEELEENQTSIVEEEEDVAANALMRQTNTEEEDQGTTREMNDNQPESMIGKGEDNKGRKTPAAVGENEPGKSTAIGILEEDLKVDLFPNPARDFVTIKVNGATTIKQISLISFQGNVLQQWNSADFENLSLEVAIGNLPSGAYFIRVVTDNGEQSKKLLVQ